MNLHLLCLNRNIVNPGRELLMLHVAAHPPVTCKSNSNWLSGEEGLRLQPYSEQAGQGCLKQGARVQIVFYKSPLQGICVYPWPLICCWGSLGKREKREWRGTPNGESEAKAWSLSFCWTSRELSWGKEGQSLFCVRTNLESMTADITVKFLFPLKIVI